MTAPIILAAIAGGIIMGWCLTVTVAAAAMSRSQTRMLRKVRYWQTEAGSARAEAERLTAGAMPQLTGSRAR